MKRQFAISTEEVGQRLDHVLRRRLPDVPRRLQLSWFTSGGVYLDGVLAKKSSVVALGQVCLIDADVGTPAPLPPGPLELTLLFENDHVVVIDKPPALASAALAGSTTDSVAAHLLARYPQMRDIGYSIWDAGLVHRLDTDTSGVVVAAKSRVVFEELVAALHTHRLSKSYLAWTATDPQPAHGVITSWLRSDPKHRQRMVVARTEQSGAKRCETTYDVVAREGDFTVVRASAALATRHQVRAHLADAGSPLIGDILYGGQPHPLITRHALHAERVSFDGGRLCPAFDCWAPIPLDLAALTPVFAASANGTRR